MFVGIIILCMAYVQLMPSKNNAHLYVYTYVSAIIL